MLSIQEKSKIRKLAKNVRSWADAHVQKEHIQHKYDFQAHSLECMCAYASTVLLEYLHSHGVTDAYLVHNDNHAFIMVGPEYVLDITATQFDGKFLNVELCKLKTIKAKCNNPFDKSYWAISNKAKSIEEAFKQLCPKNGGFPDTQYWDTVSSMKKTITSAIKYCSQLEEAI